MNPETIIESVEFLKHKGITAPEVGIVLGTGLGQLLNEITIESEVHYNHIPHFPLATVEFLKETCLLELARKKDSCYAGKIPSLRGV